MRESEILKSTTKKYLVANTKFDSGIPGLIICTTLRLSKLTIPDFSRSGTLLLTWLKSAQSIGNSEGRAESSQNLLHGVFVSWFVEKSGGGNTKRIQKEKKRKTREVNRKKR